MQILEMIAGGKKGPEIAKELWLARETVKSHVKSIREKLGASTQAHAVSLAYRQGLLSTGSPEESTSPSDRYPTMSVNEPND